MASTFLSSLDNVDNVVVVNSIGDLPEPYSDSGGQTIDLAENYTYVFAGTTFNLGDIRFKIQHGVKLIGQSISLTKLQSNTPNAFLLCNSDNSSGIYLQDLNIELTNASASIFDITSVGRVYVTSVSFYCLCKIGTFTDVGNFRCSEATAFVAPTAGLTLKGNMDSLILDRVGIINVNPTPAISMLELDSTFVLVVAMQLLGCMCMGDNTTRVIEIQAGATLPESSVKLLGTNFLNGYIPYVSTLPTSDWLSANACYGLANSRSKAGVYWSASSAVVMLLGIAMKVSGTTTLEFGTRFISTVNNRLQYSANDSITVRVGASGYITSSLLVSQVNIMIAKNGVPDTSTLTKVFLNTSHDVFFNIEAFFDCVNTNYFELWITSPSVAGTITIRERTRLIIEEI